MLAGSFENASRKRAKMPELKNIFFASDFNYKTDIFVSRLSAENNKSK